MANSTGMDIGLGLATGGLYNVAKAAGMFGGGGESVGPSYYDLLNQRNQEMQMFQQQLADSRQNYITQMGALNKTVMSQFAPNLEGQFAARGLNVTGGAYQAELARKSATLGAEANVNAAQMGQQNILSLMNWAGNPMALGNPYGEANQQQQLMAQQANSQGIGRLFGTALGVGANAMMGNFAGAASAGAGGLSSMFNRSPVSTQPMPGLGQTWSGNNLNPIDFNSGQFMGPANVNGVRG